MNIFINIDFDLAAPKYSKIFKNILLVIWHIFWLFRSSLCRIFRPKCCKQNKWCVVSTEFWRFLVRSGELGENGKLKKKIQSSGVSERHMRKVDWDRNASVLKFLLTYILNVEEVMQNPTPYIFDVYKRTKIWYYYTATQQRRAQLRQENT